MNIVWPAKLDLAEASMDVLQMPPGLGRYSKSHCSIS